MSSNVERFRSDLDKLIDLGDSLLNSMYYDLYKDEVVKQVEAAGRDMKDFKKTLINFKDIYDSWYSECIVVVKQLLPDRLNDFKSFYEKPKNRKALSYSNYTIQDYLQGTVSRLYGEVTVGTWAALPQFNQQLSILKASKQRFESSLFEIRQLVQADLFDSEIGSARELLKNKFARASGAIAGVVIEKHLQQVCKDHQITLSKKNPTINDFNEALKSNGVIDIAQWRFIGLMGDYRNLCDHNKSTEPTSDQVKELLDGTDKILKTIF